MQTINNRMTETQVADLFSLAVKLQVKAEESNDRDTAILAYSIQNACSNLTESRREFWAADATINNLELKITDMAVQLANAESKCRELAAENAGLKNPDNWLSQSDYGYEACEVATQNGATEDESLRAGMIAIINRIGTPSTAAFLDEARAQAQSEVIEWLDAEITAIDPMYRGDPSYEHDAYWMKSNVLDVVELARKAFTAQLNKGGTA